PRLAGGKRAAPGKLRLRLRWAQGMVSVYPLRLAGDADKKRLRQIHKTTDSYFYANLPFFYKKILVPAKK
ncbi:MAG: hypothetical protein IJW33_05095, partial [Lentisphaeria bacterium]|nr:hypothetical protein [Lentisphaeria bacterium]